MEKTEFIILICIVALLIIGMLFTARYGYKLFCSKLYIYPKTEHKYLPLYRCKLKCPSTGEWFDAIIYKGVEDEKYYVRERKDFFDKFVKLNDWKNGNKDK